MTDQRRRADPARLARQLPCALLLLWLFSSPEALSRRPSAISLSAIPDWVTPVAVPTPEPRTAEANAGSFLLLVDDQRRVSEDGVLSRFLHGARHLPSPSAVEAASELRIAFDPSYERLAIHGVWRWRNGERRLVYRASSVKFLQREDGLDANLLDGRLTASFHPEDLRAGDTLEYAYTLTGTNPAFGKHYSETLSPDYPVPVSRWHQRLLWPRDRVLHIHRNKTTLTPRDSVVNGERELVWEASGLKPFEYEDAVPAWADPSPWIQLSSWNDWGEVATWAESLFVAPPSPGDSVRKVVERIRKEQQTPVSQLRAALGFVQAEVRYLGLEMGSHAYRPHAPDEVLARRFGDCKDKSLLLVVLLRELGIEAVPALVNTSARRALDGWHPSHRVFDHAIVRARIGADEYWVDATRPEEPEGIAELAPSRFERALLVRSGESGLTPIPSRLVSAPETELEERYVTTSGKTPATLTVTTLYRGEHARNMRNYLREKRPKELTREYLNFYARSDPAITSTADVEIRDDAKSNTLITVERYSLPQFHQSDGKRAFEAHRISQEVSRPRIVQRENPFEISHPVFVKHRIIVDSDQPLNLAPEGKKVTGPAARFEWSERDEGKRHTLEYSYQSTADFVAPGDVQKHLEFTKAVEESTSRWLRLGAPAVAAMPRTLFGDPLMLMLLPLLIGLMAWFGPIRAWKERRLPTTGASVSVRAAPLGGSEPFSAIPVENVDEIGPSVAQLPCGVCGLQSLREKSRTDAALGDTRLIALRARCLECTSERSVYFAPKA